jgi:hypothetical protein
LSDALRDVTDGGPVDVPRLIGKHKFDGGARFHALEPVLGKDADKRALPLTGTGHLLKASAETNPAIGAILYDGAAFEGDYR